MKDEKRHEYVYDSDVNELGWHVISGTHLLDLLRRAIAGESPDLIFAELWANAEHEDFR